MPGGNPPKPRCTNKLHTCFDCYEASVELEGMCDQCYEWYYDLLKTEETT